MGSSLHPWFSIQVHSQRRKVSLDVLMKNIQGYRSYFAQIESYQSCCCFWISQIDRQILGIFIQWRPHQEPCEKTGPFSCFCDFNSSSRNSIRCAQKYPIHYWKETLNSIKLNQVFLLQIFRSLLRQKLKNVLFSKLSEILTRIINYKNYESVLEELREYINEVDS